jgi:hypothetical protein
MNEAKRSELSVAHGWAVLEVALLYREFARTAKRGTTLEDIEAAVSATLIARYAD